VKDLYRINEMRLSEDRDSGGVNINIPVPSKKEVIGMIVHIDPIDGFVSVFEKYRTGLRLVGHRRIQKNCMEYFKRA